VLHGRLEERVGKITKSLDGRECVSEWKVVERRVVGESTRTHLTLVDLWPHTGRKHQLRRHCRSLEHPIVGDEEHGFSRHDAELALAVPGGSPLPLMLAAVELVLPHSAEMFEAREDVASVRTAWPSGWAKLAAVEGAEISFDRGCGMLRVAMAMPTTMARLLQTAEVVVGGDGAGDSDGDT
jgi:hypothetical protein